MNPQPRQSPPRRTLLAQIHIGRKALGLDDDTYHDMLEAVTGKDSAAIMTVIELQQVVDHLRSRGWQNATAPTTKGKKAFKPSDKLHVRKVWALWGDLARSGALRSSNKASCRLFVERMTGCADPEWLTPEQATKVIEGLKAIQRRAGQKQKADAP